LRILFAAAEVFPFAKTGGLADMAHALPKALTAHGEVTVAMPLYRFVDRSRYGIEPTGERLSLAFGGARYEVTLHRCLYEGVPHLFFYEPTLCERDHPYGPPGGAYEDNDLRFAIFCHALVEVTRRGSHHILHLNDWHTALAAVLASDAKLPVKTLFTIHNLAYQGLFPRETLRRCGIDPRHFTMEAMEFYGRVNWLKGGVAFADAVTTVSPTYAREIQTPRFGCGLEGFLRAHRRKIRGILNGIDPDLYDPSRDPALPATYDAGDLQGKELCKKEYLKSVDIKEYESPLFIFIGRFVEQKGIDWIAEAAPKLAKLPLTLALLGEGEERFHRSLERIAREHARIHLRFGYDESLSHRMYAAADFLLMPSRFEPCGLNQMIAMRYGTLPVVHAVGGLKDTVHDIRNRPACGVGIVFEEASADAMAAAVERAVALYRDRRSLHRTRRYDMACDFSIGRCADAYAKLYGEIL
jgi:starch synthase